MANVSCVTNLTVFETLPLERYLVAFFTNIIAWPLSCVHVLIIYTVCRNRPLRTNPFFFLAIHLAIADLIQISTILLHGVFITANGDPWAFPAILTEIHAQLQSVSFWAQLLFMNFIAINRYVATCWGSYYKRIFTANVTNIICVFVWLSSVALVICGYYFGSKLIYIVYSWNFDQCTIFGYHAKKFLGITEFIITVGICCPFTIYFILIVQLRCVKNSLVTANNNDKGEMRRRRIEQILMFQFAGIVLVFSLYEASFHFVFIMFDVKIALIMLNFLNILNCTINPIMYLCFGSELKKYIRFTKQP